MLTLLARFDDTLDFRLLWLELLFLSKNFAFNRVKSWFHFLIDALENIRNVCLTLTYCKSAGIISAIDVNGACIDSKSFDDISALCHWISLVKKLRRGFSTLIVPELSSTATSEAGGFELNPPDEL